MLAVTPPKPRPVLAGGDTIIGTYGKSGVDSILISRNSYLSHHLCDKRMRRERRWQVGDNDVCLAAKISSSAY